MGIHSKQVSGKQISQRQQRKQEALELARILYDIYKKRGASDKINYGQNNANESKQS